MPPSGLSDSTVVTLYWPCSGVWWLGSWVSCVSGGGGVMLFVYWPSAVCVAVD